MLRTPVVAADHDEVVGLVRPPHRRQQPPDVGLRGEHHGALRVRCLLDQVLDDGVEGGVVRVTWYDLGGGDADIWWEKCEIIS